VQSATGTLSDTERGYINAEAQTLVSEIDRLASSVKFNGITLGDGSASSLTLFIGINASTAATLSVSLGNRTSGNLGLKGFDLGSSKGASGALWSIDTALDAVSDVRASYGAASNRLDSASRSLATYATNAEASRAQIVDADFATESSRLARAEVLRQAGVSILAQTKNMGASALNLL